MLYNKKADMGDTVFSLVIILLLFMAGSLFVNPIKDSITDFRTNIGCGGAGLSDGTKLLCLGGDAAVPYFIILLFSTIGGILLSKFVI